VLNLSFSFVHLKQVLLVTGKIFLKLFFIQISLYFIFSNREIFNLNLGVSTRQFTQMYLWLWWYENPIGPHAICPLHKALRSISAWAPLSKQEGSGPTPGCALGKEVCMHSPTPPSVLTPSVYENLNQNSNVSWEIKSDY
jgi:hypothetical protein